MSNNNKNYNIFSDEQQQAGFNYPKLNESQLGRPNFNDSNNNPNLQQAVGQNYKDFPQPQSYQYNIENNPSQQRQKQAAPPFIIYNPPPPVGGYPIPPPPREGMYQPQVPRNGEENFEEMEIGNRDPVEIICPNCRRGIQTKTKHKVGLGTNFAAMCLCIVGGGICLCVLPYLIPGCQDVVHYCPSCDCKIGTSSFLC